MKVFLRIDSFFYFYREELSWLNLVKIVMEVAKKLKGLEDDLLVAELLDVQLVEVVHSEVEQALVIRQLETSM